MRHREELDVERAYFAPFPIRHRDKFGAVGHPRFIDTVPGQAQGPCEPVDRELTSRSR